MAAAIVLALAILTAAPQPGPGSEASEELFEARIRPVLAGTCFTCHGGKKVSGGLRVDSREALLGGGDSGPAIVVGEPDSSLLVRAIRHADDELKMPPGKRLPDSVGDDFASWIRAGAAWPASAGATPGFQTETHWAFRPVRSLEPPADPTGWSDHPIDRFLSAGWREAGLVPAADADPRTLIRRLSFDLTGLPPTPEEVERFLADPSPGAFERLVDRMLDSPRYGERWGRHWMDVARYADTAGDNADYPIPEIHLYRDWIIDAFNRDMPYDRFVREQLAGDILARRGPDSEYAGKVVATGFLALSRRYATAPEELWHLTLEDTIETTGRAFLGLTLRCARCHDHKFDPVTQRDYYALFGVFAGTKFPYAGSEEFVSKQFPRAHFVPLLPPEAATPRLESYRARVAQLQDSIAGIEHADVAGTLAPQVDRLAEAVQSLRAIGQEPKALEAQLRALTERRDHARSELERLRRELRGLIRAGAPPNLPVAYAVREATPVDESIHLKGDPGQRGEVVPRGVPAFLAGPDPVAIPAGSSGRLELAEWLTRPGHPLMARVMVNRIWQHHFGRGIVATPSNFGLRGEPPTHPELLDWLAARFVAEGWSIKAMHRLILGSRAYRLASQAESANDAVDPANTLLWRAERRRLDAESIRDAMLNVSGRLDLDRPGPHPFPAIADWGWTQHNAFKAVYPSDHRSVYLMTQRLQRHPYLALFDGPDTNSSTDVRTSATVPLQALYLMNNPFVAEQASGLADRLIAVETDPEARIRLGYSLAYARPAEAAEIDRALAYRLRYREAALASGATAEQAEREAWVSLARILLTSNEFVYVD